MSRSRSEFIRLANRIAGKNRPLNFTWNAQPTQFVFSNLLQRPRGSWSLQIRMGGHALQVEINRLPELAWVSPELAGIDLHDLPGELACGLIESSFGEIFTALTKAGIDVSILSMEPFSFRQSSAEIIQWSIHRGHESHWMHGSIAGDDAALAHLASLMERAPVSPSADDAVIPVPIDLIAGTMHVSLADLQALELHDVLLADLKSYQSQRECTLNAARRALGKGHLEASTFTLKHLTSKPATTMGDAASVSVNDLEIELTFVVGQTTLTVGELRHLAPGFTFELPISSGDGLLICANGKTIGRGELIEVGDHLGVRVTEFSAS
ncbi:type III secretion system cytoplasmic ring protein SctQ [Prosthecobacter algae]|uniref:type III secretion system cytoplasmic ring protein SctQ n=1 Tax=Prosthecobacter algae TaxID=1144682 RepID=UPI0031E57216